MSRLEIIHLRSPEPLEALGHRIRESIQAEDKSDDAVTVYRRKGLETDIAVHIHHGASRAREGPSRLGLQLAASLRTFGLVEHTLWEESR